jgi:hypothetical protein
MLIVGKDRNKIDICNGYSLKDCQFDKVNALKHFKITVLTWGSALRTIKKEESLGR